MGLIVDTSEFIKIERGTGDPTDILRRYGSNEVYGVATITIAELQHSVGRADGIRRQQFRQSF